MPTAARGAVTAEVVTLVPVSSASEWTRLVQLDPRSTPFHEWDLLDGLARREDGRFRPLAVHAAGSPVGVLPIISFGPLGLAASPFLPYVGPLVPPHLLGATLRAMRAWQRRQGQVVARAAFSPLQPPPPPGVGREFLFATDTTYVLHLEHGDPEQYQRGMHSDRRANIRRAARRGVVSRPSTCGEATELLPRVVRQSFDRHEGGVPRSLAAVAGFIDEELGRNTQLIAETVLLQGEPVGMLVAARRGTDAYGWIGGVLPEALATNASTVAYDAVIRRAIAVGVRRFDLVGHVDEGVARFKRSFGAEQEQCWRLTSNLLPRFVSGARSRLRARAAAGRGVA
jgi:hypothetical protein